MGFRTTKLGDTVTIHGSGEFNFSSRTEFHQSYENEPGNMKYVLDCSSITSVDSSALGMMLMLRKHAGEARADITISNCSPQVEKLFVLSQFDKLFKMR